MDKHKNTKVIITCRTNYYTSSDIQKSFGHHNLKYLFICPFAKEDITRYIDKYFVTMRKLSQLGMIEERENYTEKKIQEQQQQYKNVLQQYPQLLELSQSPFTLRMIIMIIPKLLREINQNQSSQQQLSITEMQLKFHRFSILQNFISEYVLNESKRLEYSKEKYSEFLDMKFDFCENDYKSEERLSGLISDVKI